MEIYEKCSFLHKTYNGNKLDEIFLSINCNVNSLIIYTKNHFYILLFWKN